MELLPIVKSSAGLDVHLKIIVVTLLQELDNDELKEIVQEFSTYPDKLNELAYWLYQEKVELVVIESTGFVSNGSKMIQSTG